MSIVEWWTGSILTKAIKRFSDGEYLTKITNKKENKDEYKKPELINIDDPDFDETGQGASFVDCGGRSPCPTKYAPTPV